MPIIPMHCKIYGLRLLRIRAISLTFLLTELIPLKRKAAKKGHLVGCSDVRIEVNKKLFSLFILILFPQFNDDIIINILILL